MDTHPDDPPTGQPHDAARPDPVRPDPPVPPPVSSAILTLPNVISLSRLLLMPVCAWLLAGPTIIGGILLTGAVAATDWLDGWVARRTRSISRLGQLLDPVADRLLIASVALALLIRDVIPWPVVVALVGRDLTLMVGFQLLQRRGIHPPEVIWLGKTATAFLLTALPVLAAGETGIPGHQLLTTGGLVVMYVGLVGYYVVGVIYARAALAQLREANRRPD